jgi:hypothetical protein
MVANKNYPAMGQMKNLVMELTDLTAQYIWEHGTVYELDEHIQEELPQYYGLYLENKEYIIDGAMDILRGV